MAFLDETGLAALWQDVETVAGKLTGESDGYARGGLAEVTAKGHAEQVTTTGKNLLPNTATSQTVNGVTFTVNADGSVTANGTATANAILPLNASLNITDDATYTFSGLTGGSDTTYKLQTYYRDSNGTSITSVSVTNAPRILKLSNIDGAARISTFILSVLSGTTVSNLRVYPQIELGSTATEYEPYTGGAPSPSPEFPQTIEVVRGRNLLDATAVTSGKYLASGGTETNDASYSISDYVPVEVGATYVTSGMGAVSSAYYAWYNASKTYISATQQTVNGFALTAPSNAAYVRVSLLNASLGSAQLECGSDATPYVPYGHVGMEAQGKNLINPEAATLDYWVKANGAIEAATNARVSEYIPIDGGLKYYLQNTYGGNTAYAYAFYDSEKAFLSSGYFSGSSPQSGVINTPSNARFIRVNWSKTYENVVQLKLGDAATEYEPYYHETRAIPLPSRGWVAGLPDGTADSLRLDGAGKCEWVEATDEVVFDGTIETFTGPTSGTNGNRFTSSSVIANSINATTGSNLYRLLCSHGIPNSRVNSASEWLAGDCILHTRKFHLVLPSTVDTASSANAWLSTHPVTVLYPLATPVIEDCGYVEDWPTDIPEGATVTIPELDEVGIKYFIDSSVTELAKQWYARARSEYADELLELRATVAELATRIQ